MHDGTVGGGVNFLLFLLASLRIETVTWALPSLTSYGGWKCDQKWTLSLQFY